MGLGWRSNFDRRLQFNGTNQTTTVRQDGSGATYNLIGGVWTPDAGDTERLTQVGSDWHLTDNHDTVEVYDSTGKLVSVTARNGYQQTLQYNGTNQLTAVTDSHGRQLTFTYAGNRLATMTDPEGLVYTYGYGKRWPCWKNPIS